jgi:hypothetical protein
MSRVAMCEVNFRGETAKNKKTNTVVSIKKKWIVMNPI